MKPPHPSRPPKIPGQGHAKWHALPASQSSAVAVAHHIRDPGSQRTFSRHQINHPLSFLLVAGDVVRWGRCAAGVRWVRGGS